MANDVPDGLAIEQVWLVEADYTADARERRPAFRAEHLGRIGALRAAGVVIEAGGLADWSGAVLIVRAPDEAAAVALLAQDVYARGGVWTNFRARRYGRVVRADELPTG